MGNGQTHGRISGCTIRKIGGLRVVQLGQFPPNAARAAFAGAENGENRGGFSCLDLSPNNPAALCGIQSCPQGFPGRYQQICPPVILMLRCYSLVREPRRCNSFITAQVHTSPSGTQWPKPDCGRGQILGFVLFRNGLEVDVGCFRVLHPARPRSVLSAIACCGGPQGSWQRLRPLWPGQLGRNALGCVEPARRQECPQGCMQRPRLRT